MELITRGNYVSVSGHGVDWGTPVAIEDMVLVEMVSSLRATPSVSANMVVALPTVYLVARSGLVYV